MTIMKTARHAAALFCAAVVATIILASSLGTTPAIAAVEWPIDGDCTACHTKEAFDLEAAPAEPDVKEAKDTEATDASSQEAADDAVPCADYIAIHSAFGCAVCHADEKLGELHDGVAADDKMPKKLKKTKVDAEICLVCHESYDALAEKTADSQALVDDNGTVVNPHALPDVTDHEPISCVDCHTVHKDADKPVTEKAKDKCLSCHHENVFECGTCHEG